MTDASVAPREYFDKVSVALDPDCLRGGVMLITRLLMETEVSEQAGAGRDTNTLKSNSPNGFV